MKLQKFAASADFSSEMLFIIKKRLCSFLCISALKSFILFQNLINVLLWQPLQLSQMQEVRAV